MEQSVAQTYNTPSNRKRRDTKEVTFRLDDDFILAHANSAVDWGPIGYVTYKRTYARSLEATPTRYKDLGISAGLFTSEEWWLTIARVVEGTYRFQEEHCHQQHTPWFPEKAQRSAQEMYSLMFDFKFLPSGRGLWMMGTDYVQERGGACLNSCAFVTTDTIDKDFSEPFTFLMDMSMIGVGVGTDCRGVGKVTIQQPVYSDVPHVVADTREGWIGLVDRVLLSWVGVGTLPRVIDVSGVRKAGIPIKGFGGTSSGPGALVQLITDLNGVFRPIIGKMITATVIVDAMNFIGKCVVAGNIRRSAEIIFGSPLDNEFLNLKNRDLFPEELESHRWASNNSVFAWVGQDYTDVADRTCANGEPGYLWLENSRMYGRMKDPATYADELVIGSNPCGEQPLENKELCNLVETYPARHNSYDEFERTLKHAYLYAKTVTLITTHNEETNRVMLRNRRIGTSMSGIVQALEKFGHNAFMKWCDTGYDYLTQLDQEYSRWLCIPMSIKRTSVKPSGTNALLPGATAGIHRAHSAYYYRVIRFAKDSKMLPALRSAGYKCVDIDPDKEPNTTAVYFPVKEEFFDRSKKDVSMWEQVELAAQMQHWWADNQVSCTVSFKAEEAKDLKHVLAMYDHKLKGISFLPLKDHGYNHAPYQEITEAEYLSYTAGVTPVQRFDNEAEVMNLFCDSDKCVI